MSLRFCTSSCEAKNIISDLSYLDIRVGKIVSIADHPEADRLYVQEIDVGDHLYEEKKSDDEIPQNKTRSIIAGIKDYCSPDELLNTNVVVVCNLKPRKLKGVPSEGMILCCSNVDKSDVKPIRPVAGSSPGDPIRFPGIDSLVFPPGSNKISFNKIDKAYKAVCNDFVVNEKGVATWNNLAKETEIQFETYLGPITGSIIDGTIS